VESLRWRVRVAMLSAALFGVLFLLMLALGKSIP
jgi:hypothetical protein